MEPPALRRDASSYESLDKRYLWHPFTQHQFWNQCSPLIVDAAEGFELIDVDGGPPLAELGTDLFGDALGCHPDGSITYLQRPVVEVDLGGGLSQPEPDHDAPVDLVHIEPDGTSTTITSGGLRMI